MVLFWNGVDTIKYAFIDPLLAVESFGLMIHKSPIVFKECERIMKDIEYLEEQFILLPQFKNLSMWTHLLENVVFNYGDVLQNLKEANESIAEANYTNYGKSIGRIIADVFFINSIDN